MHVSQQKRAAALRKRELILRYLIANPGINQQQLCDKFQTTAGPISQHVKAIRDGWRPDGWVEPELPPKSFLSDGEE